jgi:hypothetical protein
MGHLRGVLLIAEQKAEVRCARRLRLLATRANRATVWAGGKIPRKQGLDGHGEPSPLTRRGSIAPERDPLFSPVLYPYHAAFLVNAHRLN